MADDATSLRRVLVVGTSGAGKTTFARMLAARLAIPHVELDALHCLPAWTERTPADFRAQVAQAIAGRDRWVIDGNYSVVRDILWPQATDVVWLDYSRPTVFGRILRRTLRRAWTREPLWAGNTESLSKAFLSRDSILLWSLSTHGKNRRKFSGLQREGLYPQLRWHVLRSPSDAHRLLAGLASPR